MSTFNLRSTGLSDVEEFSMTAIETVERRCSNISFQQQYSQALNCLSIPGQIENQIETFVEMKPLRSPVKIPLTITPPVPQAEIREKKVSL